jgi:hypothetical protein
MAIEHHFEVDEAGGVKVYPLAGWTTAPVHGMALVVKLDYYASPAAMTAGETRSLQTVWTPIQCREFAALLLRMADHLSEPPKTGVPQ